MAGLPPVPGAARPLAAVLGRLRGGASRSGLYLGDRMVALGAGFLVNVLFARLYGLQEVGQYLFVLTTVQIASATLQGSCEPIIVRDLVRHGGAQEAQLGTCFATLSLLSVGWTAAIAAVILVAHGGHGTVVTMTAILLSQYVFLGFACLDYLFKARTDARRSAGARITVTLLLLVGRIVVIVHHMPLLWVAAASALEGPLTALALVLAYVQGGGRFRRWRLERRHFAALLRQALTASVSMLMVIVFFRVGIWLVEHFDGFAEVGRLSLAIQVAGVVDILPTVASTAFYPRLVALHDAARGRFLGLLAQVFRLAAAGSYVCAIGLASVAAPLAVLVFGHKFAEIRWVLIALAGSIPSNWSGMVRAHFINIIGRQDLHVVNAALGILVLLAAGALLIPAYGATGAAIAMTIAHVVSSVLTSFLFAATRPIGWLQLRGLALFLKPPGVPSDIEPPPSGVAAGVAALRGGARLPQAGF